MQGLILAAGMGSRLKHLTADNTKCMIKVNGVTLIERMLHQIEAHNLSRIVIVTGYEGDKLRDYIATLNISTPIVYVDNPIYDKTNNIYSLALAKDFLLEDDTILFESDLIFEDSVLTCLLTDPRETLALVDKYESWMDGTVIKIDDNDHITAFVPGSKFVYADIEKYYKTVNLYKFSKEFSRTHYVPFLDAYTKALGENEYYEQVLRVITLLDEPVIEAKRLEGQKWYEIDDTQDLDIASSIFHPDPHERRKMFESRYGGYWRYPQLLDYCYLVNPYFPPRRMKDEIKANFDVLLAEYPSGMRVNSLLAAKNFGLLPEQVVVGNGAAELIKSLMLDVPAPYGIVRPTFEEYPNRHDSKPVVFRPNNPDFRYSADDLMDYFDDKDIRSLILINPDNPSGNFIARADVERLAKWCTQRNIFFVLDESFIDFAEDDDASLLHDDVLDQYPQMVIVKSISKSFGVAGLRLGILASGNRELIATMKKDVAIWNINSFAEFYLQIEEKYKKDYAKALVEFRAERANFIEGLSQVPYLRVLPSQANFVTCEVLPPFSAGDLTTKLLEKSILIKDLSPKTGFDGHEYIRLAVRDHTDNQQLIQTLHELLK
ncbi:MAG: aminotransferase class I/II-fold pyridoxal phosphate-dependent enzyme [Actinomycetaceae bacterium]|nr:aminotransferase class I/II-fold pyridoxal phosphate-dependent enzyme [Actinomycetaceae bacterium]MDO5747035.1 aminotransferase class I/II-fold pyridoxal phosphate-dependent enzyme [Actinomycetaceae bacterium]